MSRSLRLLPFVLALVSSPGSAQHLPPPIEPGKEEAYIDARLDELAEADDPARAAALVRLAFTAADPLALRGELALADELFGRVLEAAEAALEDRTAIGELLCHSTRVPMWREEFPVAEEGLRAALEDLEPGTLYSGIANNALAICVDRQGRGEEALEIAYAAIDDFHGLGPEHLDLRVLAHNTCAVILSKLGRTEEASDERAEIERLMASSHFLSDGELRILQLDGQANLARTARRWEDVDRYFTEAIAVADADPALEKYSISMRDWFGGSYSIRGDPERAVEILSEAVERYERRRARHEGVETVHFASTPWEAMAEALALAGDGDGALEALDRHRGRWIFECRAAGGERWPDVDEVRASLGPDEALIGWLFRRHTRGFLYVLRNEGPARWIELPVAREVRQKSVRAFGYAAAAIGADPLSLPDVADFEQVAREFYRTTFAPAEPLLEGVESLFVVSAQDIDRSPLEAAIDDEGRWLADRFAVTKVPSGAVHAWLRRNEHTGERPTRPLFLGDPPFRAKHRSEMAQLARAEAPGVRRTTAGLQPGLLPRLSGTRGEVLSLAGRFRDAELLLGNDATREALLSRTDSIDLLHLATHARFVDGSLSGSSIYLACDEEGTPSALSVEDIAWHWRLDAQLVTLSACSTGREWQTSGGAEIGFPQAFLAAGARSVLVSRWAVDDHVTQLFMEAFYDAWLSDERASRTEAVRRAARYVRELEDESGARPYAHPYYWAAFSLHGDGR